MKRMGMVVAAAVAMTLGGAGAASAVTYETEPPFCQPTQVVDLLAPLAGLPELNSPPSQGSALGFGPGRLAFFRDPALISPGGRIGFKLTVRPGTRAAHPNWRVTTTFAKVDESGRVIRVVKRTKRTLRTISQSRGGGAHRQLGGRSGLFRTTVAFRSENGRLLGSYGFYTRLLLPDPNVRLAVNSATVRPGQTLFARIENPGSIQLSYGVGYEIQRSDGSAWVRAPENLQLSGAAPSIAYGVGPGFSSRCLAVDIPPGTAPGRYRIAKQVDYMMGRPPERGALPTLYAEFDVIG